MQNCLVLVVKYFIPYPEEAEYLEQSTRLQAQYDLWFEHRKAELLHLHSQQLVEWELISHTFPWWRKLCSTPPPLTSSAPVLKWGVDHDDLAQEEYIAVMKQQHEKFECNPAGLNINPKYPHLGALPDSLISCVCCGVGLLEIKCCYKCRDTHPLK